MKKLTKIAVGLTLAATVAASAGILAGCNSGTTGEAYGLVHGAGYVGYSTVKVDKDKKVKDATLTEVCLPTQVKAGDDVAEADKVAGYYKTVKYDDVTLTYSETANDYMVGLVPLKTYLYSADNAKAYYKAVMSNSVKVSVGGQDKGGVMTKAALSKEENGYWDGDKIHEGQLGWKVNRQKTVDYVKQYGVEQLMTLTKDGTWKDANGVDTGATWTDLNTVKVGSNSYAYLILQAYGDATKESK